jgi:Mrp family chromosome partitioning ATPase
MPSSPPFRPMRPPPDDEPTQVVQAVGYSEPAITIPKRQAIRDPRDPRRSQVDPLELAARNAGHDLSSTIADEQYRTSPVDPKMMIADEATYDRNGPVSAMAPSSVRQVLVEVITKHNNPPKSLKDLFFLSDPDSEQAASFRILRQRLRELEQPFSHRRARVIAVTSPEAQEGKTTATANLALAMAEHGGAKVLLLEANVRSPALGHLFGFEPVSCFAEQMISHRENPMDSWKVVEVFLPNMHAMVMSPKVKGQRLLNGPALQQATEQLKFGTYDYIMIDCPPVLGHADVNLIEDCADSLIMVVKAGKTSAQNYKKAIEQLSPNHVVATVLMGT